MLEPEKAISINMQNNFEALSKIFETFLRYVFTKDNSLSFLLNVFMLKIKFHGVQSSLSVTINNLTSNLS